MIKQLKFGSLFWRTFWRALMAWNLAVWTIGSISRNGEQESDSILLATVAFLLCGTMIAWNELNRDKT